jgi:ankyrin repeat protein
MINNILYYGNNRVIRNCTNVRHCEQINGDTPLHLACEKGLDDTAALLVQAGAAMDIKNKVSLGHNKDIVCLSGCL